MKKIFLIGYSILCLLFIIYLLLPAPNFPNPPHDAVQSEEPADSEDINRRAYFTNYTREQVMQHYLNQFNKHSLRLNYPPEEAQTIIRDQTRSYYLEELVHPFRESVFINGFIPQQAKDEIWYKGVHYEEKITIKYVRSNVFVRVSLAMGASVVGLVLLIVWQDSIKDFFGIWTKSTNGRK